METTNKTTSQSTSQIAGHRHQGRIFRTQCPTCESTYQVERQDLYDSNPQFDCIKCQARFGFSLPGFIDETANEQEVSSYLIAWQKMPNMAEGPQQNLTIQDRASYQTPQLVEAVDYIQCPKCKASNQAGGEDCRKCGVVFSKVNGAAGVPQSTVLESMWQGVLDSYPDETVHERFLLLCQKREALTFAAHKYQNILAADPSEEIALKMRRRTLVLAEAPLLLQRSAVNEKTTSRFNAPLAISLVGGLLVVVGGYVPKFHHLIWVGLALIAMVAALKAVAFIRERRFS